ncbi:MAG: HEAT repeat domain-containing protein, partial [Planctomycetes bacterium]|nr:HEAT repeat domain-containing protein [Planctomycetota bacterium]
YEMGHDDRKYPIEKIMAAAELAASLDEEAAGALVEALDDRDSAVRYWAAMGLLMRGADAVSATKVPLNEALDDNSPYVRTVAAEALGRYGGDEDVARALRVLMELAPVDSGGVFVSMLALNALDAMDAKAAPAADAIRRLPQKDSSVPRRMGAYVPNLIRKTTSDLE